MVVFRAHNGVRLTRNNNTLAINSLTLDCDREVSVRRILVRYLHSGIFGWSMLAWTNPAVSRRHHDRFHEITEALGYEESISFSKKMLSYEVVGQHEETDVIVISRCWMSWEPVTVALKRVDVLGVRIYIEHHRWWLRIVPNVNEMYSRLRAA